MDFDEQMRKNKKAAIERYEKIQHDLQDIIGNNEELKKSEEVTKEEFKKRNKNLKDIINNCYCDIFDLDKAIFVFRKLIIQRSSYEKVTKYEEEIRNKMRDIQNFFEVKFYYNDDYQTKFKFVDPGCYEFKDNEWKILSKVCNLYIQLEELIVKIFTAVQLGCSYEVLTKYSESSQELLKSLREYLPECKK